MAPEREIPPKVAGLLAAFTELYNTTKDPSTIPMSIWAKKYKITSSLKRQIVSQQIVGNLGTNRSPQWLWGLSSPPNVKTVEEFLRRVSAKPLASTKVVKAHKKSPRVITPKEASGKRLRPIREFEERKNISVPRGVKKLTLQVENITITFDF